MGPDGDVNPLCLSCLLCRFRHSFSSDSSQSAAACLLGQLGQQGVTFDLQPVEWIAAASHALSAPAEVRRAGEDTDLSDQTQDSIQGKRLKRQPAWGKPRGGKGAKGSFLSSVSAPR